jgi:hypothetical protein
MRAMERRKSRRERERERAGTGRRGRVVKT